MTAPATAPIGPTTKAPDNAPSAASPPRSCAIATEEISDRASAAIATIFLMRVPLAHAGSPRSKGSRTRKMRREEYNSMQIRGPTASSLLDHLLGAAECLRRFALPSIADEIISSQRRHRIRVTPRSVRRPNLQLRNTLCSEPSAVRPNRNASDAAFLLM